MTNLATIERRLTDTEAMLFHAITLYTILDNASLLGPVELEMQAALNARLNTMPNVCDAIDEMAQEMTAGVRG